MNIVSSSRMKEIDRVSIEETGFGNLVLMENAGIRILEKAGELYDLTAKTPFACVAGGGNNGGDALVIARQIFSRISADVTVITAADSGTEAFDFHLNLCRNLGIKIIRYDDITADETRLTLDAAGMIFDGLSGTGIRGALRAPGSGLAELINNSSAVKIAVDVPSGIGDSYRKDYPAVRADYTLTVELPKRCLYLPDARPLCGEIHTVAIGFPEKLTEARNGEDDGRCWQLISDDDISRLMPDLNPADYKNSRGHLAVFAGTRGTAGAASLCADAAIHTSAGLVSLFADSDIYDILAAKHKSVMVKPVNPGPDAGGFPGLEKFTALAVGPGWGTQDRKEQLRYFLEKSRGVLDADGINVLAEIVNKGGRLPDLGGGWVLTPHAGEFRRLFPGTDPLSDPYSAAVSASEKLNCVILLKGAVTFIAEPGGGRCAVLDGCFPKLGTAGSGDLLCGLIGGYMASGLTAWDAAVLAAAVHLRAGKRCGRNREWFAAEDIIEYL